MARRSGGFAALAVGLFIVVMIIVAAVTVHDTLTSAIPGMPMAEELPTQRLVLVQGAVDPGGVYELAWTTNGWALQAKPVRLVEIIKLDGVDVAAGDAIAPHLYDIYVDGVDDYVRFDLPQSWLTNYTSASAVLGTAVEAPTSDTVWYKVFVQKPTLNRFELNPFAANFYWWLGATDYTASSFVSFVQTNVDTAYQYASNYGVWSESGYAVWQNGDYWHKRIVQDGVVISEADVSNTTQYPTLTYYSTLDIVIPTSYTPPATAQSSHAVRGRIGYVIAWYGAAPDPLQAIARIVQLQGNVFFYDATFYNGTHYIDLVNNIAGMPYGNPQRVPAEKTWLWLIKGLTSDGKLHLRFFPPGTIVKIKDAAGNVLREYTVDGPANEAGLVEDYAVDLGAVSLQGVSVEAIVPSPKARIYAPAGFIVRVEGNAYSQEYIVPETGYVDVAPPDNTTSVVVKIIAKGEARDLAVEVQDYGSYLRVRVYNATDRIAVAGAIVIAEAGNKFAHAITDEDGYATINIDADSVNIKAYYLADGVVHTAETTWTAPHVSTPTAQAEQGAIDQLAAIFSGSSDAVPIAAIIAIIILAMLFVALRGGRR